MMRILSCIKELCKTTTWTLILWKEWCLSNWKTQVKQSLSTFLTVIMITQKPHQEWIILQTMNSNTKTLITKILELKTIISKRELCRIVVAWECLLMILSQKLINLASMQGILTIPLDSDGQPLIWWMPIWIKSTLEKLRGAFSFKISWIRSDLVNCIMISALRRVLRKVNFRFISPQSIKSLIKMNITKMLRKEIFYHQSTINSQNKEANTIEILYLWTLGKVWLKMLWKVVNRQGESSLEKDKLLKITA